MKILYMGTPDFAVPSLLKLIENKYEICGVLTQPDKPKGRGHKLTPPPVKECAIAHNIPVFQPETLKNEAFSEELKALNPDIIVVAAYGKILPSYILDYPKYGCINIHGSILPKYRGAAPIQRAVIDGEKETGITIQLMNEGIDTGDIIYIEKTPIGENETAGELFDRLALIGADVLIKTLDKIKDKSITRTPQNHDEATYAKMLDKETGKIDWTKSAKEITMDEIIRLMVGRELTKLYPYISGETFIGPDGNLYCISNSSRIPKIVNLNTGVLIPIE